MARKLTLPARVEMIPFAVSQARYQQALDEVAAALLELSGQLARKSVSSRSQAVPTGPDSFTEKPFNPGVNR